MAETPSNEPKTPPPAPMLAPMDLSPANFTPNYGTESQIPITEDTDLSTLTPQQIHELNQNMLNEVSDNFRPLISDFAPISVLRDEYQSTSFTGQIDMLQSKGYNVILRTRGDGDCFYRSIGFAYIEQILNSSDLTLAAATALSNLEKSRDLLDLAGFQKVVYEDFYDAFASMINEVATSTSPEGIMTHPILLSAFQNAEVSNSVVVYLRLLASAQIQADAENYEPFLLHPELGEPLKAKDFCSQFVEAIGKEADHVQVAALSRALNLNVQVAYLDGRGTNGHVDFVPFNNSDDHGTIEDVILLYRPGHYDVLQKGTEPLKPLVPS